MKKDLKLFNKTKDSSGYNVIVERDTKGYFVASVPELPGCHTQAKSFDTLMKRIHEVVTLYLEVQGQKEDSTEFVGFYRIQI